MNDLDRCRWSALGLSAVAVAALWLTAAPSGAADDVSQTRAVSGFDRIRFNGAFDAAITAGVGHTRVVVVAAGDVVDRVTTEVTDGTLEVGLRSGTNVFLRSPRITIELPALRALENTGAGSMRVGGLTGADVEIVNSGAASIVVAGRAKRELIRLNGAGKIDATGVDAHDVSVENDGVGSVRVRASGQLTMTLNGVGEIRYTGEPTDIQSHVNGVGRIGRL